MIDEISLGEKHSSHEVSRQEQLIIKYFGNIEDEISKSASRRQALEIGGSVLRMFKGACLSELLFEFLQHRVFELVDKHWPELD